MMNNDRMTKDVLLNWYEHLMLVCIDASFCIYLFMLLHDTCSVKCND